MRQPTTRFPSFWRNNPYHPAYVMRFSQNCSCFTLRYLLSRTKTPFPFFYGYPVKRARYTCRLQNVPPTYVLEMKESRYLQRICMIDQAFLYMHNLVSPLQTQTHMPANIMGGVRAEGDTTDGLGLTEPNMHRVECFELYSQFMTKPQCVGKRRVK